MLIRELQPQPHTDQAPLEKVTHANISMLPETSNHYPWSSLKPPGNSYGPKSISCPCLQSSIIIKAQLKAMGIVHLPEVAYHLWRRIGQVTILFALHTPSAGDCIKKRSK